MDKIVEPKVEPNGKIVPIINKLYCYFSYEKHGESYKCKFLKKGIEANDRFLWLKDIFGQNSASFQKSKGQDPEDVCSICFLNRVNTIITPCRHMCLCYQ